ncbi:MAG: 2'-5' RNA ligase family protein [Planctomycetota bacterium]
MSDFVYAEAMQGWPDWQQEYRYGVLLIYPPAPLRSSVNRLRARHDPTSHAGCEAHISLTVPFPRPVDAEAWEELQGLASRVDPIEITYGPLRHYLPHPGVCLAIDPQGQLEALLETLESASVFTGATPRRHRFSAHMTVAEFIDADQTRRLMDQLSSSAPSGRFVCREVAYAVPDEGFSFKPQGVLMLGRATGG